MCIQSKEFVDHLFVSYRFSQQFGWRSQSTFKFLIVDQDYSLKHVLNTILQIATVIKRYLSLSSREFGGMGTMLYLTMQREKTLWWVLKLLECTKNFSKIDLLKVLSNYLMFQSLMMITLLVFLARHFRMENVVLSCLSN